MNHPTGKFAIMAASVALAAILAAVALIVVYNENDARAVLLPDPVVTVLAEPKALNAFALTDQDGHVLDASRLRGRWTFLFFGYTFCPDVCPTTLAELAQVRDKINRQGIGSHIQFLFVSVDPNRDTEDKLKQYVGYFGAEFVGATGSNSQIAGLAGQVGARYEVHITPGSNSYPVYHSAAVYLVDPGARLHAIFNPPYDADRVSARFKLVRQLEENGAG